jgi:hypothetical protein
LIHINDCDPSAGLQISVCVAAGDEVRHWPAASREVS